ncbi:MAG: transposase [Frankiaceae bacterium]|nr:transposase [Frankiaceae bacterium]
MAAGNRKDPQRAKSSESRYSLMEFMRDFPDDETCLVWLWQTRFETEDGTGAWCRKCGEVRKFERYGTTQQRQSWTCTACGLHVHPTAGTIFHKSSTSLHLWFYAMYLMTSTRCGISAKQLERELGVTYKTAWRMFHLIRNELMVQDDEPLSGAVEADETYVGGRPRLKDRARYPDGRVKKGPSVLKPKTMVVGAVERGGRVKASVVPSREGAIGRTVESFVKSDATLYTDEHHGYVALGRQMAGHHRINHGEHVYVSGDVHTQTIEGFWSLVKRGIGGTHHAVSAKHLQGYLNEYVFRYNHRDDEGPALFALLLLRAASTRV